MNAQKKIVSRAVARCANHLPGVGVCHMCCRAEREDHLAEEHPQLKRDDIVRIVDEWILAVDDATQ